METRSPTARAKFLYLQLAAPEKVDFTKRKPTQELRPLSAAPDPESFEQEDFNAGPGISTSEFETSFPTQDEFYEPEDDGTNKAVRHTYRPVRTAPRSRRPAREPRRALSKWITRPEDVRYRDYPTDFIPSDGSVPTGAAALELDRRIADAALRLRRQEYGSKTVSFSGQGGDEDDGEEEKQDRAALASLPYAQRRKALREQRRRHAEAKMGQLVHAGRMPWKIMLDDEVARDVETDIGIQYGTRAVDEDPDAYDTDELLSDVSDVSSTDSETDTPSKIRRREKHRRRIRRMKIRVLRRRKREAKRKRKETIERAQHRYYDEMIQEICNESPQLRAQAPGTDADLESKRSFIDRGQAEIVTQQKVEQMRNYISFGATGLEAVSNATKFPRLNGLSARIDQEINQAHARPLVAQMARKHLRQGPSSPEMSLVWLGLTLIAKQHMANISNSEGAGGSGGGKLGVLGTLLQKGASMFGLTTPTRSAPPLTPTPTPTRPASVPISPPTTSFQSHELSSQAQAQAQGPTPTATPTLLSADQSSITAQPSSDSKPLPRHRYIMQSATPYASSHNEIHDEEEHVHDASDHF